MGIERKSAGGEQHVFGDHKSTPGIIYLVGIRLTQQGNGNNNKKNDHSESARRKSEDLVLFLAATDTHLKLYICC